MSKAIGELKELESERVNVMNMSTGKVTFVGVVYRMSAKDRGLMFSYCPYCGVSLKEMLPTGN
jgi:hypothetical protein